MIAPLETAVVLIVFNRPDTTKVVFDAIAAAKPRRLLLVADGPRSSRPGEVGLCDTVQSIIHNVDWQCEVLTNVSKENLGCQERVISGLNWAFNHVEEAIILEDDCVPHPSFFRFCQEMLQRFRNDARVGLIRGNNFVSPQQNADYSYYFSKIPSIWGWATWRQAWQRYDRDLRDWPSVRRNGVLREIFSRKAVVDHWTNIFQSMHNRSGPNTWDYQWVYTLLTNNMLSIAPNVNMVRNIGFGESATHTSDANSKWAGLHANELDFPLAHPPYVVPSESLDDFEHALTVPTNARRILERVGSYDRNFKQFLRTFRVTS